jgi:hypothetical protein
MNQKGFANIILVIIIVILAVAAGYFVLVKKSVTPKNSPQTSQLSENANWKTYQNSKFGFVFKYPDEFVTVNADNFEQLLTDKNTTEELRAALQEIKDLSGGFKGIGAEVILGSIKDRRIGYVFSVPSQDKSNGSFEEYAAKLKAGLQKNKDKYGIPFDEKNIEVGKNRLTGIEFYSLYRNVIIGGKARTGVLAATIFKYDKDYFEISPALQGVSNDIDFQKYIEIYHKIISTISFDRISQ